MSALKCPRDTKIECGHLVFSVNPLPWPLTHSQVPLILFPQLPAFTYFCFSAT